MSFLQILDITCEGDIITVIGMVKFILSLIQFLVPCVLIILGTIDMFKAMTSGDEKATKEAQKKFVRRIIYAIVIFLIPFIVSLAFTLTSKIITSDKVDNTADVSKNFFNCWSAKQGSDGKYYIYD